MSKRTSMRIGTLGLALVVLAGCAESSAKGAIIGGTAGAIVGAATSGRHVGGNLALGAVIGGLLGALVGEVVAHHETRAVAAAPRPPVVIAPPPPPPPPGGQWTVVNPVPPPPTYPPGPSPDPTRGVISNNTPWEVHVFINTPPGSPGPLMLRSGDSAPVSLDVGRHRIVAQAFVDTQYGRRLVGTFDQTLAVDPRAPGWTIRFFEANF